MNTYIVWDSNFNIARINCNKLARRTIEMAQQIYQIDKGFIKCRMLSTQIADILFKDVFR